jgi:hypothetical protein
MEEPEISNLNCTIFQVLNQSPLKLSKETAGSSRVSVWAII